MTASSPALIAVLAVVVIVEVSLLAWALVDLYRRPTVGVVGGRKLPWLVLCLLVQVAGPIVYLAAGRERSPRPAASGPDAPASPDTGGGDRTGVARGVVATLFGDAPAPDAGGSDRTAGEAAVELTGVRKTFGETVALDGLTLSVPQGSIYGFLGPNGAGKTTTLRILAGLARAGEGRVQVLGHAVGGGADVRSLVGYLPDVPSFYAWMTAPEYLHFAGSLFGLSGAELDRRVRALLDLSGLSGERSRVGGFSRGMKQRLGVAQALVSGPRLLLLDEPTSALDPIGRRDVLEMIASLRGRTTVLFSTHILADVERVCDTVAVVTEGRVVAEAGIDELRRRRGGRHRLLLEVDDGPRLVAGLSDVPWVRSAEPNEAGAVLVAVDDLETAQRELPALVARLGLALRRFAADELSLEDVFVYLVGNGRR